MKNPPAFSRRNLIKGGAALATLNIVPSHVLGGPGKIPPSEQITLAGVGVGGVGHGQLKSCAEAGFRVVSLCDVDDLYAKKSFDHFKDASRWRDFREMLDSEGDKIDAVYCGTPDHTHAIVSLAALRAGKHVATVKPLTRTIHEGRILAEAARAAGVQTQMSASSAVTDSGCRMRELLGSGIIGDVTEVHIWSNRPLWPHGMATPSGADPVPGTLDWKLWLGPAPERPFKNEWPEDHHALAQLRGRVHSRGVYHPWNFRGWHQFGTGALGDMGCHHFNVPRLALKLGHPESVSATCTKLMGETWPLASMITYDYPAREGLPPLRLIWYDGGLKPPRPGELESNRELADAGILYVGSKGKILDGHLIPASKMEGMTPPPQTLERRGNNWEEWIEAIRGGDPPSQTWHTCAVPLTEMVLLGNIALRTGQYLKWDGPAMRFTNSDAANSLLQCEYHNGWSLDT